MKLEQIEQLWGEDCKIDPSISTASSTVPVLHHKYYKIYINEKLHLHKLLSEYKQLKLAKYDFLLNPTLEAVQQHNWTVPARGKILRPELSTYLEGDKDLVNAELRIALQQEKVDYLKSILDSISKRTFLLRNILEDRKFQAGQ
jgi:hypothetical protein